MGKERGRERERGGGEEGERKGERERENKTIPESYSSTASTILPFFLFHYNMAL